MLANNHGPCPLLYEARPCQGIDAQQLNAVLEIWILWHI